MEAGKTPLPLPRVSGAMEAGSWEGRGDETADSGGHVFSGFGCKLVYYFFICFFFFFVRMLEMD